MLLPKLPINNMTGIVDSMGDWVQNSCLDVSPILGLVGAQFQMGQSKASYNKQGWVEKSLEDSCLYLRVTESPSELYSTDNILSSFSNNLGRMSLEMKKSFKTEKVSTQR